MPRPVVPAPSEPFPDDPARLLDRSQVAAWLGLSVATIDRMTRDGRLRAVRIGGRVKYDRDNLGALVASGGIPTKDQG